MRKHVLFLTNALFLSVLSAGVSSAYSAEIDEAFFENRIRPLFVEKCHKCHSHEKNKSKGGLFVDSRDALLSGGDNGTSIVPGNADKSLLITAVNYVDPDLEMPPKNKLSSKEIADLTAWVNGGAPWPKEVAPTGGHKEGPIKRDPEKHWAWDPVKPVSPPIPKSSWAQSPIDQFIEQGLRDHQLKPAQTASPHELIRRASYLLTGLPPTAAEIVEYTNDKSGDAFQKMVSRYLASPRYGEHWARHWLDLVRYAESRGHEFDPDTPNAYQYRDYVIRALNADVPYDEFAREHIAGDLLKKPRVNPENGFNESVIGTGFWYLGEMVHSPVDIFQDESDRIDNQIDVMGKTFMGITIGCARCHDHKFDPITAKDYYALGGIVRASHYRLARFETEAHNRDIAKQLRDFDDSQQKALTNAVSRSLKPTVSQVGAYLSACLEVTDEASISKIANNHKLDQNRLKAWWEHLQNITNDRNDPFYTWAQLVKIPAKQRDGKFNKLFSDEQRRITDGHLAFQQSWKNATILVNYQQADAPWYTDSPIFSTQPYAAGHVQITPVGNTFQVNVHDRSAAVNDATWKLRNDANSANDPSGLAYQRGGRTLRTPTFILGEEPVHVLMRGYGVIYASIGNHIVIQGPLHGQILRKVLPPNAAKGKKDKGITTRDANSDWRWVSLNLKQYAGKQVHFEITPASDDFAIAAITQSKQMAPPQSNFELPNASALTDLPKHTQSWLEQAIDTWNKNATDNAQAIALVSYIVSHAELFGGTDSRELLKLHEQRQAIAKNIRTTSQLAMAMADGDGSDWYINIRGVAKAQGDVAPRGLPESLFGKQPPIKNGSGRLEIAERMTTANNPLFARVMVNRIWHHLMGCGLVPTVDNFGALGERPTHPELLDYLATEFVKQKWSIKRLILTIMSTAAWQMSSVVNPAFAEKDPNNIYYHHALTRRLSGEMIRDTMLQLSGQLKDTMYGRSIPVHLSDFMQGRGRPKGGPIDGDGRRSIYIAVRRNFLSPMMLAFDTPIPFNTMGRRSNSNVPAQALALLNDPFIAQQCELWIKKIIADKSLTTEQLIAKLYTDAFAHEPSVLESAAVKDFLGPQPQEADWIALGHTLVNVKEFIFLR